jgi:glycosyltransferase involved in cell wall biosynthesis
MGLTDNADEQVVATARRAASARAAAAPGAPAPGAATLPLEVVVLGDWLPFPRGMAATSRARLVARALRSAGIHSRVVTMQAADRPTQVENTAVRGEYQGVPFEYTCGTTVRHDSFLARRLIATWGWLHGAARLVRLRREGRLDAVCLWLWTPRPAVRLAFFLALLRRLGVPVVREIDEIPWAYARDRNLLARLWSPVDGMAGVIAISAELRDWAARQAHGRRRDLRVIEVPILVDLDERAPAPYPTSDPLVVFAGAPGYESTIRFVFAAMEEVWRTHPECRLAVTGAQPGDPRSDWLRDEVAEAGLGDRVDLVGYVTREELLDLYARAHALLIPLFYDPRSQARFPTKIGEYLAAARPVVTSDVGEILRFFSDGVDALVRPAGEPVAFGRAVVELLDDPARAALIGQRGRELAERRFDYALYAEPLADLFAAVCGREARR